MNASAGYPMHCVRGSGLSMVKASIRAGTDSLSRLNCQAALSRRYGALEFETRRSFGMCFSERLMRVGLPSRGHGEKGAERRSTQQAINLDVTAGETASHSTNPVLHPRCRSVRCAAGRDKTALLSPASIPPRGIDCGDSPELQREIGTSQRSPGEVRTSLTTSAVAAVEVATGRSPGALEYWLIAQPRQATEACSRKSDRPLKNYEASPSQQEMSGSDGRKGEVRSFLRMFESAALPCGSIRQGRSETTASHGMEPRPLRVVQPALRVQGPLAPPRSRAAPSSLLRGHLASCAGICSRFLFPFRPWVLFSPQRALRRHETLSEAVA